MMASGPRILVASDASSDATLVRGLLRDEFDDFRVSVDPDRAVADFEAYRPQVLVLAFNGLEKAERYYLGLYRLSAVARGVTHRTLILCNKDDLRRAYEQCRKGHFDDYVLFWPLTNDAPRLAMAVHHAFRDLCAAELDLPSAREFAIPARQMGRIESVLERYAKSGGKRVEEVRDLVERARQDLELMLAGSNRRPADAKSRGARPVAEPAAVDREFERRQYDRVGTHLEAVARAMQPVHAWTAELALEFAPQVECARTLRALAERVRPLILLVDDDLLQHRLVGAMLRDANMELACAASGTEALAYLRSRIPDLILMDVDLPDMDGLEATRRLKAVERFARIPVLVVTGHSDRRIVEQSAKAGGAGFVVKPFDGETLLAKVDRCLAQVGERG